MTVNNLIIEKYAPVMIPTLCRYEHFKKCIDSLMECTFADKTDVYIGLDFPTNDKQWVGYNNISIYLNELEKSHKFKSLTVIRRETNFGFGKNGNASSLRRYLLTKYDRIIFSEDDNQFSPAFLDFINKGLTLFEKDKNVFAICGYRHFYNIRFSTNTFFRQSIDFNAWGYGIWKDRIEEVEKIDNDWFKNRLSLKSLRNIRRDNGNDRCYHFITFCLKKKLKLTDIVLSVYIYLNKMYVIMPRVSLVRNIGMDKSGVSFQNVSESLSHKFNNQIIYERKSFDFIGSGLEFYDQNRKIYKEEGLGNFSTIRLIRNTLIFFLKRIF